MILKLSNIINKRFRLLHNRLILIHLQKQNKKKRTNSHNDIENIG